MAMALSEERGSISRRMVVVFLSTFALTTLGFMGATLVLRIKAERILADSAAISGNAVPSMQRLSSARTTLRHLEVTLDDYVDHSVLTSGPQQESPTIAEDRQFLREQWDAYMALPTFPQERSLWPSISSELRELDGTVNRLLEDLRAGTTEDVEAGWDGDTKRLFDQLDARFYDALLLNAAGSAEAAGDIGGVEHDLRTISTTLNVLCALFALFAAYIAVRVFRQYAQVTEDQIGNLELFAGRVAHDLRAPLSSVSLAIQYAREHATEPRMKNVLSRAHRTLQRTGELVDGLMLLASAPAAQAPIAT
jgi:signal transduction histidine kinase